MKNQFTSRIVKLTFAFMLVLIASSCSQDDEAMDAAVLANEINSEIAAKGAKVVATVVTSYIATPAPTGCGDSCVTDPVEQVSTQTITWGNSSKDIIVTAWNDSDKFYIKVNSSNSVNIDGVKISYPYEENNGGNIIYNAEYSPLAGVEFTYAFDLLEGWQACDAQNYAVRVEGPGGAALFGQTTYNLFDICKPVGCEESFSYVDNEDGSYTFKYTPAEDMTDAELVFTFAQGTYVSGLDTWTDAGVTKHKTMNLPACTEFSWTVVLQSDCTGGGQKKANVWTDFNVNDVSKKNANTPTLEMPCN